MPPVVPQLAPDNKHSYKLFSRDVVISTRRNGESWQKRWYRLFGIDPRKDSDIKHNGVK